MEENSSFLLDLEKRGGVNSLKRSTGPSTGSLKIDVSRVGPRVTCKRRIIYKQRTLRTTTVLVLHSAIAVDDPYTTTTRLKFSLYVQKLPDSI